LKGKGSKAVLGDVTLMLHLPVGEYAARLQYIWRDVADYVSSCVNVGGNLLQVGDPGLHRLEVNYQEF
jgi:hypothetical protein